MNILLTKKLPGHELELVHSWNWSVVTCETLKITLVDVHEIPPSDVWIVSSRNSLSAVKKFIDQAPATIYCIGHWIKEQLTKCGVKSFVKNFESMKQLATELNKQGFQHALYYCGTEHRRELEEGSKNLSIKISKVFTHQSEMTCPVVDGNFDVVFIFSPRSAESLLKNNSFTTQTIFACIGVTTASYLGERGVTNIFTASYPDSHILLEEFRDQTLKLNN
jgi:uroporphyrinogen-III synthase